MEMKKKKKKKETVGDTVIKAPVPARVAIPRDAPLPEVPANFKSKLALYDLFKPCWKCGVKKYVNRGTNRCFSCTGIPYGK